MKYVALLRGINVGGNVMVPMARLKKIFESFGFSEVTTLLASGNVVFEASKTSEKAIREKIEKELEKIFKRKINVITRSIPDIEKLVESEPFKKIKATKDTRLFVTFLSDYSDNSKSTKIPKMPDPDFQIVKVQNGLVCSVLQLRSSRSVDLMSALEKEYGKNVTTRNWNTVLKILKVGKM